MRSFFETTEEDWTHPAGQLHFYLTPREDFAALVHPYEEALEASELVALQPSQALHATAQRLPFFADSPQAERIDEYIAALHAAFCEWDAPAITFTAPIVTEDSVLCPSDNLDIWGRYTSRIRQCLTEVFGPEGTHFGPVPRPHITLAYGIGSGDSTELEKTLRNITAHEGLSTQNTFYSQPLDHLDIVTVHQKISEGTYLFDTLNRVALT
ncbi:hypothetical protein [Schaalia sp. lx-100]|uniref:hypothetical protein n=1 Tax=Schaalia sp. lx-100 TaxID=2899081 RepID=UPI001E304B6D|nr:hypothetical protein [Schaalia sp. lx-100]MCD4557573.1 hypothetical protein [Schaalia sp. lx-100]